MEDVKLYDERERHWRMVFEHNYGGVDDKKALINDKRWNVSYHRLFQKVTLKLALLVANIFVCWHPASERTVGLKCKT